MSFQAYSRSLSACIVNPDSRIWYRFKWMNQWMKKRNRDCTVPQSQQTNKLDWWQKTLNNVIIFLFSIVKEKKFLSFNFFLLQNSMNYRAVGGWISFFNFQWWWWLSFVGCCCCYSCFGGPPKCNGTSNNFLSLDHYQWFVSNFFF